MKVLDLFAGTRSICKAFEERGHETYAIEIDRLHENIDWYTDIMNITADDIVQRFGIPDVIWASPPCTTYSIAGIGHHRRKVKGQDHLEPFSKYGILSDELVKHTLSLIETLRPTYFFIENPRGGLRKMDFMQHLPRYTLTYCQYGDNKMKPTDIWTNHPNPNFHPMCKNGDSCHDSAPRGSKNGTQAKMTLAERSKVPHDLCLHIARISEG